MTHGVLDLQASVPAKDPALSRRFYSDLGFTMNWGDEEICEFQLGAFRFLLQKFCVQEHAGNFMMHPMVEDADTGWQQIERAGWHRSIRGSWSPRRRCSPGGCVCCM